MRKLIMVRLDIKYFMLILSKGSSHVTDLGRHERQLHTSRLPDLEDEVNLQQCVEGRHVIITNQQWQRLLKAKPDAETD